MHFTGTIYRPPVEPMRGAHLLQVTVGCAHNKCRFCNMYRDVQFSVEPLAQVEADIIELRQNHAKIERIFLVNGDPFGLSTKHLQAVTDKIKEHIPEIQVICMYASINNIKHKTDEELTAIHEMRINDLWIGTESGNAESIIYMKKGTTLEDTYTQLERLNKANIRHNHCYILGIGGRGKGTQNAIETANLINTTKPSNLWFCSLGFFEGSEMPKEVENGNFIPASELEILEEEMKILELLNIQNAHFYGVHPTNAVSVHGSLPQYKKVMIEEIKQFIKYADKSFLEGSIQRIAD